MSVPSGCAYEIGAFHFEPATGELVAAGRTIRLRRQAARSLELLARCPGELVTRDDLRRDIWGDTYVDFGQGLNTCIKEVRLALGDPAEAPRYVETLPRRGYRLVAPVRRVRAEPGRGSRAAPADPPPHAPGRRGSAWRLVAAMTFVLIGGPDRRPPAVDPDVELWLARGRHLLRTREAGALVRGFTLLGAATERSPGDPRVWSALADLHRVSADRDPSSKSSHRAQARRAAALAVQLDPGMAAGHASMGGVLEDEGRVAEAEAEYRRAVELDPSESTARQWLATLLWRQGRLEEAFEHARAARETDPLSPGACTALAYVHLLRGDVDPARAAFEEALSIEPEFVAARVGLARTHTVARDWEAALTAYVRLEQDGVPADFTRSERAYVLAKAGRTDEARRLLKQLSEQQNRRVYDLAAIHASLGDLEEAFGWLDMAIAERALELRALPADPRFETLRGEPRFTVVLRRAAQITGAAAPVRPGA